MVLMCIVAGPPHLVDKVLTNAVRLDVRSPSKNIMVDWAWRRVEPVDFIETVELCRGGNHWSMS